MEKILVLGAGKSSAVLIQYLALKSDAHQFKLLVADANEKNLSEKTHFYPHIETYCGDLSNENILTGLISSASVVVSLLPPFMHIIAGKICLAFKKHLLSASYISPEMKDMHHEVSESGLTFLMECGLDPGIDHMSAMKILDQLKEKGAIVDSFKSYCGGLVAPESDDNPWGYKITWNPRNVVTAGKGTAQYLEDNIMKYIPYHKLFERTETLDFEDYGCYEAYPNRDCLPYINTYNLSGIKTFIRGTVRKKGFSEAWNYIVQLGLTDESVKFKISEEISVRDFVAMFLPAGVTYSDYLNIPTNSSSLSKLEWLGLNSGDKIALSGEVTPADCLQAIIEDKWKLKDSDKDLVLMQHRVDYDMYGKKHRLMSSLAVKGDDHIHTAMAKTVGLPLAICTLLLFVKKIENKGVIIPNLEEIYNPVLKELHNNNLIFREYTYS